MQWSNLNEQMIEQFFMNTDSPTNAQCSLNFTRTSRQSHTNRQNCSNKKSHFQTEKNLENIKQTKIQNNMPRQNDINPETDIIALASHQISNFNSWLINSNKQNITNNLNQIRDQLNIMQCINLKDLFSNKSKKNDQHEKIIKTNLLTKLQEIQNYVKSKNTSTYCQNCHQIKNKCTKLQLNLSQMQVLLQDKQQKLQRINQIQIQKLGEQIQFQVENNLLKQRVLLLSNQNQKLNEIVRFKEKQLLRLNDQIQKFNLQKSTYHFKSKTLENRLTQMQKSKGFLLSAAKNSTTHSDFNITNTNNITNTTTLKSSTNPQTNQNDISSLIHTNNFICQKSIIESDDYISWFQRIKTIFLQKYKRQQKQHLIKYQLQNGCKNDTNLKDVIANFKKGHIRYQVARCCKTIADYIKKNKENFLQMLGQEFNLSNKNLNKQKSIFMLEKELMAGQKSSLVEQYEEQLKKAQKVSLGLQSQISNLNNQLITIRKTLMKQKQQKKLLSMKLFEQKQQFQNQKLKINSLPYAQNISPQIGQMYEDKMQIKNQQINQLNQQINQLNQEINQLNQQIKKVQVKNKKFQQSQQKMDILTKQLQYLLYQQRKQKIKYFQDSIESFKIVTACRIRNKNLSEKHVQTSVHQFEGRIHVQNSNISFKYDIVEHSNKKPMKTNISSSIRKIVQNLFYGPAQSLILSTGSIDSQFRQLVRSQNGIFFNCLNEIFKQKQSQKRFLQTSLSLQIIQMTNYQILDMLDSNNERRKVSIKKDVQSIYLSNCNILNVQSQKQTKQIFLQSIQNKKQQNSNVIILLDLTFTDKRNKSKYQSKLVICQMGLFSDHVQKKQSDIQIGNLITDSKMLWSALNSISFSHDFNCQKNRLTYVLQQTLRKESKNLVIVNVSPTQTFKEQAIMALKYGHSLRSLKNDDVKSIIVKKQKNIIEKQRNIPERQRNINDRQILNNNFIQYNVTSNPSNKQLRNISNNAQKSITGSPYFANKSLIKGQQQQHSMIQIRQYGSKNMFLKHRNSNSQLVGQSQERQRKKKHVTRLSIC